jgi:predicted NBD/HSP70 family sugar kinase
MKRLVVGIDIGGSKIALLAREPGKGRDVHQSKIPTPQKNDVGSMLRLLDEQLEEIPGGRRSATALGVAVPGHVDDTGHVLCAGNLDRWVNVPLREQLEDRYGIPVAVERDANCGAIGEKWVGAAKEMNDFVLLALGTGVGAGIFIDGSIYRGAHYAAGEAGDITFPKRKPRKKAPTVSDVVGKFSISKKAERATGKKMSASEALERASEDRVLEPVAKKVVDYLSASVVAISALLDPEAILFGGGTSEAGEALLQRVRDRVAERNVVRARLILAGLGSRSQVIGALWLAEQAAASSRGSRTIRSAARQTSAVR